MTKDEILEEFKMLSRERRRINQMDKKLKALFMPYSRFKIGQSVKWTNKFLNMKVVTGTVIWVSVHTGEFRYNISVPGAVRGIPAHINYSDIRENELFT